jgi:tetratricopeptide (TPR) repeat protein
VIHYLRGQADEVLACADRALAHWQAANAGTHERAPAIQLRGLGHRLKKDYPAAITAYREVLDLDRSLSAESTDMAIDLTTSPMSRSYPAISRRSGIIARRCG